MSLDLTALKGQLRIDGAQDDAFITELIAEAQDYIMSGIDSSQPLENFEQYKTFDRAVALLVGHWYFNRSDSYTSTRIMGITIPYGIEEIVNQLRGKMVITTTTTTQVGVD